MVTDGSNYSRKKIKKDYCIGCRNRLGFTGCKGKKSKHLINMVGRRCKRCKKLFKTYNYTKMHFCSVRCVRKYQFSKKYDKLLNNFSKNIPHISYLVGIILGDGTIIGREANTTRRIMIYTDTRRKEVISSIEHCLYKLGIQHSFVKNRKRCVAICFSIPNRLLVRMGITKQGKEAKYGLTIPKGIKKRVEFIIGLINSDGYYTLRGNTKRVQLSFSNNSPFIIGSLIDSLDDLKIRYYKHYRLYKCMKGIHRTCDIQFVNKDLYKLFEKSSVYKLKTPTHTK